ncbi:MAG: hypothetical protein BGO57_17095 [Sphingomonadales bacterium 63-6]|nr:MAG: hypothetical protein BGO57_17095 [Sphingomonadales bacterium 63-6]
MISGKSGLLAMAGLMAVASIAQAEEADLTHLPKVSTTYAAPKTSWGEPDLRGTWPIDYLNGTPMQRAPEQGNRIFMTDAEYKERADRITALASRYDNEESQDRLGQGHWVEMGEVNRRTSLMVAPANGRLPEMTAEGKRLSALMRSSWRKDQTFDVPTDFDSWDRCITRGLPASMLPMMYNNGIRVFQSPGIVAIQLEMIHETRIIPTDGRPALPAAIGNWMGESRGHWENGNTLVVETVNFRPGASATNIVTSGSPPENDTPISTSAKLEERFTITGPDSVTYDMTWTDPVIFTQPWAVRLDWKRDDAYQFFEYACHEGNVQLRNYVTASRATRAGVTLDEVE